MRATAAQLFVLLCLSAACCISAWRVPYPIMDAARRAVVIAKEDQEAEDGCIKVEGEGVLSIIKASEAVQKADQNNGELSIAVTPTGEKPMPAELRVTFHTTYAPKVEGGVEESCETTDGSEPVAIGTVYIENQDPHFLATFPRLYLAVLAAKQVLPTDPKVVNILIDQSNAGKDVDAGLDVALISDIEFVGQKLEEALSSFDGTFMVMEPTPRNRPQIDLPREQLAAGDELGQWAKAVNDVYKLGLTASKAGLTSQKQASSLLELEVELGSEAQLMRHHHRRHRLHHRRHMTGTIWGKIAKFAVTAACVTGTVLTGGAAGTFLIPINIAVNTGINVATNDQVAQNLGTAVGEAVLVEVLDAVAPGVGTATGYGITAATTTHTVVTQGPDFVRSLRG